MKDDPKIVKDELKAMENDFLTLMMTKLTFLLYVSKVEKNIYQSATSLSFSIDHKTMTSSSTGCGHLALIVC